LGTKTEALAHPIKKIKRGGVTKGERKKVGEMLTVKASMQKNKSGGSAGRVGWITYERGVL